MKLFEIDEDTKTVQLNKEWIFLIPEFSVIIKRDKGSPGDSRGQYKLRATKEFSFIYFMMDFNSPIREWKETEKRKEALYYAGLEESDIDDKIREAMSRYDRLQIEASRSLRTLKSVYKGMDEMDKYFENVNFDKTDKMGKLLNTPQDFIKNTALLNKMYDEVKAFEKRVETELKENAGIQGKGTLGDNEGQKKTWSEAEIAAGSEHTKGTLSSTGTFDAMLRNIQATAMREKAEEQATSGSAAQTAMEKLMSDEVEEDD